MRYLLFASVLALALIECMSPSSSKSEAPPPQVQIDPASVNIKVVTHPRMVEGLRFLHGETIESGYSSSHDMGEAIAHELAQKHYSNLVVYAELKADKGISLPPQQSYPDTRAGTITSAIDQMSRSAGYAIQSSKRYIWVISVYEDN